MNQFADIHTKPWKAPNKKEFDEKTTRVFRALTKEYGQQFNPDKAWIQQELSKYKEIINASPEPVYLEIVCMIKGDICYSYGAERLGYSKLTLYQKYCAIHPDYRLRYFEAGKLVFEIVQAEKINLIAFQQSYYTVLPMWDDLNKKTVLLKQRSTPVQFDEHGNMVAYMNYFQYYGEFMGGEPIKKWFGRDGHEYEKWNESLRRQLRITTNRFSNMEIIIMQELVDMYKEGIRSGKAKQQEIIGGLALRLSKNPVTIKKQLEILKQKAIEEFGEDMRDKRPQAIALFCYAEKLV